MPLNNRIRSWDGQRIWIQGASSGIGNALARALIERGARVAITARDRAALEVLAQTAKAGQVLVLPADITVPAELVSAWETLKQQWSGLDLLVLLAGTHQPVRAWELDADSAERLFQVNVFGALRTLSLVLPDFISRRTGGVAIVSSVAGYCGLPTSLVYGASKAALNNLAETLYLDLHPKSVGVYLVAPGFVKTPLTDRNPFEMPAMISAESAALEMIRGFEKGAFEIHFPRRFTLIMKLIRMLPYRLFFPLIHRITGL